MAQHIPYQHHSVPYFQIDLLHAGCLTGMAPEACELKRHAEELLVNKMGHINLRETFTSLLMSTILVLSLGTLRLPGTHASIVVGTLS